MIPALLDREIHLPGFELPESMVDQIIEDLTILVEDEREETEEVFELWRSENDELVIPRGYAFDLADLAEKHNVEFDWEDRRVKGRGFGWGKPLPLEAEQKRVVQIVLEVEQGIVMAPTGMGKTVTCLEILRVVPGKSIVVVNTKEIAAQWVKRAREYIGEDFPVGVVGDGKFEVPENGLTVALQGTLWSRREQLDEEGFFDQFAVALLDECHHGTARTFNDIFARFSSRIRVGVSATPEKTGEFRLAEAVVGPIVVEVHEDDVDRIEKPVVEVIETKLGLGLKRNGRGLKKASSWAKSKNFNMILRHLIADEDRLALPVTEIWTNQFDHRNLVIAKRIEPLEKIYDALEEIGYPDDQLLAMVGAHALDEREAAIEMVDAGPCVLLTTLADEALDAPLLEVLHLIYPTANPELLIQQIGRVRRKHPEKKKSVVIDYRDKHVPVLEKQYMTRRHEVYDPRGFKVIKRKRDAPHELVRV